MPFHRVSTIGHRRAWQPSGERAQPPHRVRLVWIPAGPSPAGPGHGGRPSTGVRAGSASVTCRAAGASAAAGRARRAPSPGRRAPAFRPRGAVPTCGRQVRDADPAGSAGPCGSVSPKVARALPDQPRPSRGSGRRARDGRMPRLPL